MLKLDENEKVVMVLRKHWYAMMREAALFAILLILPPLALNFLPLLVSGLNKELVDAAANFFLPLYIMAFILLFLLFWTDYYLDVWIVTDRRLIDVEQKGLFNRRVSEIPLNRVQDVTLEVRGIVETMLKFGNIRIQTAGEREFLIEDVPRLYEAKDIILKRISPQNERSSNQD